MKRNSLVTFFDTLEDRIRERLSRRPIFYAFVGGVGVVLFWKGVWETAEMFAVLHGPPSVLLGVVVMLISGLFVSFFIGDSIILSGYLHQKKLAEKTEEEVAKDVDINRSMKLQLDRVERELKEIKEKLSR